MGGVLGLRFDENGVAHGPGVLLLLILKFIESYNEAANGPGSRNDLANISWSSLLSLVLVITLLRFRSSGDYLGPAILCFGLSHQCDDRDCRAFLRIEPFVSSNCPYIAESSLNLILSYERLDTLIPGLLIVPPISTVIGTGDGCCCLHPYLLRYLPTIPTIFSFSFHFAALYAFFLYYSLISRLLI